MYTFDWSTLLYRRNWHDMVMQLYSNKFFKVILEQKSLWKTNLLWTHTEIGGKTRDDRLDKNDCFPPCPQVCLHLCHCLIYAPGISIFAVSPLCYILYRVGSFSLERQLVSLGFPEISTSLLWDFLPYPIPALQPHSPLLQLPLLCILTSYLLAYFPSSTPL